MISCLMRGGYLKIKIMTLIDSEKYNPSMKGTVGAGFHLNASVNPRRPLISVIMHILQRI